jgi:threonine dehydrogenase-like Zn-dependent dehydrogenase
MAREHPGSDTIDYTQVDSVLDMLKEITGRRSPDSCIDAVGMEARGTGPQYAYDRVKQALRLEADRGQALRSAQQHGQAYMDRLLAHAQKGELNPAYLATHRFSLEDAPRGYDMFKHKTDGCVRAVFAP